MKNFCLLTLFICFSGLLVWGGGTSEKAVYDLIERVTPGYASQYRLEMIQPENGSDLYEVDGDGQRIILRGNNAASLPTALNRYFNPRILRIPSESSCHGDRNVSPPNNSLLLTVHYIKFHFSIRT